MGEKRSPLAVIILAAGQGTRMKSDLVKVLHPLSGRPMLAYPLAAACALEPERLVVVVGKDGDRVREVFTGRAARADRRGTAATIEFVLQAEQRGTGDAVLAARETLADFTGEVLILYGDTPLLRSGSLRALREAKHENKAELMILSAELSLPGRIVRDDRGRLARIVETTDATPEELAIREGNTGVYLTDSEFLWEALARVDDRNAQGEIYLTDVVSAAVADRRSVDALRLSDPDEALGVNTRAELAEAAAIQRRRIAEHWMAEGVTLIDPTTTFLDSDVEVGRDTVIEPGCVIQGATRIGAGCHIKAHTTIEDSELGDRVTLGPSAHLRAGNHIGDDVRIGNFVEVKNSVLGTGVKADHLSYIGDADVGAGASFGCGSIIVNYDGVAKHRTRIGEGAFVGCNVNLVAPVSVEPHAFVAAGSTITRDVPSDALAIEREQQRNIEGWRTRRDEKKRAEKRHREPGD